MKKYIMVIFLGVLIIVTNINAQSLRGTTMFVAIRSVSLKSSTGLLARTQGTLNYGAQVIVIQENGRWAEIRSAQPALSGWVNISSLTSKRITSSGTTASASELALAGKGFSEEAEKDFKTGNNLDYRYVDLMENTRISDEELQNFLTEGRLRSE